MSDWYENVYHASEFPKDSQEYWRRVRYFIIERDGYRCQACRKKGKQKDFTVHHITPRIEGGTEEPDNLITLHEQCHDYVEAKGYRKHSQILNCTKYLDKSELTGVPFTESEPSTPITPKQLDNQPEVDSDEVAIICQCGIRHIRLTADVGNKVTTIKCICGLIGTLAGSGWTWEKPKQKKLAPLKKKDTKPIGRRSTKPKYQYEVLECPFCEKYGSYRKDMATLTCECGGRAMRVEEELIGVVWYGFLDFQPNKRR